MKTFKFVLILAITGILLLGIYIFDSKEWPMGSAVAGTLLGLAIPAIKNAIENLMDTTDWKVSQRKLMRGGFLKKDTVVRISFAYLYRIKVEDKYFLIRNARGTEKYQPVGGVYKFLGEEKLELKNLYHVMDDNKISIDESSRNDYRLRLGNQYLRKFVKRFDSKATREQIYDLSREFREELIESGLLSWNQITYRTCGRHITPLEYGKHFQMYELLLADVVELLPTQEQEKELIELAKNQSDKYIFATAEEIISLGVDISKKKLTESIADHSVKIIQETEPSLIRTSEVGKRYTVDL